MNLSVAFDEFLLARRADGCRPSTIKWYSSLLKPYIEPRAALDLADITARECRAYIVELRDRPAKYVDATNRPAIDGPLSAESIRGHITALHSFWSFCAREYRIESPMRNIKRPPPAPRVPRAIAPGDFIRLFNATGDDDTGVRDRALLTFFADTGVRLGGLCAVRVDQLDLAKKRAQTIEKGNKLVTVRFTKYTVALMSQWLLTRSSSSDLVFTNMATGEPLTPSGVAQLLKRLKRRAGIVGRVNPHSFRHRFALEYRLQGGDISTLALFMNNSIETTFAYYSIFDDSELDELRRQHDPMVGIVGAGS